MTTWYRLLAVGFLGGMLICSALAQVSPRLLKEASIALREGRETAQRFPAGRISLELKDVPLERALNQIANNFALRLFYSELLVPAEKKISLNLTDATFADAMQEALAGTGLEYMIREGNQLVLTAKERVEEETGTIVGRVLEARTNKPLPGANVFVEGTSLGTLVDAEGNFKIERVPPGKYKLRASVVGYGKISKDITVRAGNQASMDFFLDETTVGLDEVVVTGVALEARRKEIPADISVMTTKQIEDKSASNVADLLKGEIPGVQVATPGLIDISANIYLRGSGASVTGSDFAQIYIDGIETSSSNYISTIDPNSIERIEVIRGPHAAALYGTGATAGIINIVTKKGGNTDLNRPKVNARISAGYIESEFLGRSVTPAGKTPLHMESDVQISGGKQGITYRAGVSYATTGEWVRHYGSEQLSMSGGMRFVEGPVAGELSVLWSTRDFDYPSFDYYYSRWPGYGPVGYRPGMLYPNWNYDLDQVTLGLNVSYQALPNWIHNVVVGQDNNANTYRQTEPFYFSASDSLVRLFNNSYSRRSVRYNTSFRQDIGEQLFVRLSGVAEYSVHKTGSGAAHEIKFDQFGDIVATSRTTRLFNNLERWTAGYSGVLELGYLERLYLTLSSAVNRDPRGYEKTFITPPRLGVSYFQKFGAAEVRVRGQYGSAVKPLNPAQVQPTTTSTTTYYLPNFDLIPEKRAGWDAGVDIHWGNDASFSFTRFDEEGKDVIQVATIDPGPPVGYQYQNIGRVGIVGYELRGKLNFAFAGMEYLTLSANYTFSDNRILALTSFYKPSPTQLFQAGDRMRYVPTHSGGGALNVNFWKGGALLNWQFSGRGLATDHIGWLDYRYGTAKHRDAGKTYAELGATFPMEYNGQTFNVSKNTMTRSYSLVEYPMYIKFDFNVTQQVMEGVRMLVGVKNIFNDTSSDVINLQITQGRVTTLGIRVDY